MSTLCFEKWQQSRLTAHGYAPGPIDGIIGKSCGPTRSERRAHDDEPKGFIYIVPASIKGGSPIIFYKLFDRRGHWSVGQSLRG